MNRFYLLNISFFGIFIGNIFNEGIDNSLNCFGNSPLFGTLTTFNSYQNFTNIDLSLISYVCREIKEPLTTIDVPPWIPTPLPVNHIPNYPSINPYRMLHYICYTECIHIANE